MIYNWYQSQVLLIWVLQPRVKDPHFRLITIFVHTPWISCHHPLLTFLTSKFRRLRCPCTSNLKALGIHVYFAITKDSYCSNGKNFEANAKALHALKSTLNDEYLSRVANIDSAFVAWNTLTSLGEKDLYYAGSDSDVGSDTSNLCYMVQGDNPLEITTESEVEENDMSYDELTSFCQQLLEKYDMLLSLIHI